MTTSCDLVAQDLGTGVASALTAVDCIATQVSEKAFGRLFESDSEMAFILSLILVLYVAFLGFSLMLGRSNLSIRSLIPRIMTIGLVLTFATSFVAFSTVFYNIFVDGPDWIATQLTGTDGSATATFAQKLDVVFIAVQQASGDTTDISMFSPEGMMWSGAMLLLLGTVGLLVTARIGLALLLAVGPIFVVLALFNGTRGLFTGWLKGVTMLSIAPLFAVLGGSIMLEVAVPILSALVAVPGQIDHQAAMAFFVVGFVHVALMMMALTVSVLMVGKWQVFGFVPSKEERSGADMARTPAVATPMIAGSPQSAPVAPAAVAAGQRRIDIAPQAAAFAANDTGGSGGANNRTVKVYATSAGSGQAAPLNPASSRTRGIGNRFRTVTATAIGRKMENTK